MKGSYAYKIPWKRWDSYDAFPERKLFLNLLAEADSNELGMKYDFRFLTKEEASKKDERFFWFEVEKILEFTEHSLFYTIHDEKVINYYLETSQDLEKVPNIFIRVNSGGTQLSYSDLLLSIASAQWKDGDAREEVVNFLADINEKGYFSFDKDFALKSCLVLSGLDVAFMVDNFNVTNMKTIGDS